MQVPPFWQGLDRQSSMSAGTAGGFGHTKTPGTPPAHGDPTDSTGTAQGTHSPISQFSPVKPWAQLQLQTEPLARHVPPCRHGLFWHGSDGAAG